MAPETDDEKRKAELAEELEAERKLNAKVHRHMGMSAAIIVLVAVAIALYRIPAMFGPIVGGEGISPWAALGIGSSTIPWLLLIIGIAVLLSMGTTRVMTGLGRLMRRLQDREIEK